MTPADFKAAFVDAHPMSVDFAEQDYRALEAEVSGIAHDMGYRLAGYRLGRAVFTTKPRAPDASNGPSREAEPSPV